MKQQLRTFYYLTKPGIIRGNLFAATAGFLLASGGDIDLWLLLATWGGIALVIACGCVFNNYIDRNIDKKMKRTQNRALVSGAVSGRTALAYGTILGIAGLTLLAASANWLTVGLGLLGLFFYVVIYGIAKRRTVFGTIVGSISGALPPVAGYTAASNQLDTGAVVLFLVLVCWQMPHFYAIAMFRHKEYAAAGLPVLPVVHGMRTAKIHILTFIAAFIIATLLLPLYGYTGFVYTVAVGLVGLAWLAKGMAGFHAQDDVKWARGMFFFSLTVITVFCLSVIFDVLLLVR